MKIDMFCEIQDPRPWEGDHERRRILEALEQAELADEMGYGCWWQVEHHAGEEFSLSSAPELILTAISQRTKNIRLGHSAVLAPYRFNHPIRVAERAAYLDHLSGGRLELGLTRSGVPEWRLFGIEPEDAREQLQEAFEVIPKMWTEEHFSWQSRHLRVDNKPIVPKPYQKPHPPLWQPAASPTSFAQAGANGVGALGVTLWASAAQVSDWIGLYRQSVRECTKPVGHFLNDNVAFFTFVHCAETDEQARRNGAAAAAAWYTSMTFTFFEAKSYIAIKQAEQQAIVEAPGGGGLVGQFVREQAARAEPPNEAQLIIGRIMQGEDVPPDEIYEVLSAQASLIAGSPETCRKKMQAYADLGIDRLMCFQQVGGLRHEDVMKSIRLIGELIPELDPRP
jgi:alkanesulfonate monooxygenase SsuD/methylene tetrahydromethanopterin reductase-like flavin-dependent oxidoreductase (luciferase family)